MTARWRYGISAATVHSLPIVADQVVTPDGLSGRCRVTVLRGSKCLHKSRRA